MYMVGGRQFYVATVPNVDMAATFHDINEVQMRGLAARTNFSYSVLEFLAIMSIP